MSYAVLPYLTDNALRRYPFKDGTLLTNTLASYTLPNDIFLDACVAVFKAGVNRIYLSRLYSNMSNVIVELSDADTATSLISVTIPAVSIVQECTITGSNADCAFKLVVGAGLVKAKASNFNYFFTASATELCPKAINPAFPQVSRVSVDGGVTWASSDDLTIEARYNLNLYSENGAAVFDVVPNGGAGLYDGCKAGWPAVNSINGVASYNGAFFITTDNCYAKYRLPGGMVVLNKCAPACLPQQYVDVGKYMNRITDAMMQADTLVRSAGATVNSRNATLNYLL